MVVIVNIFLQLSIALDKGYLTVLVSTISISQAFLLKKCV